MDCPYSKPYCRYCEHCDVGGKLPPGVIPEILDPSRSMYVYFRGRIEPGGVARTESVKSWLNIDYGPNGEILGLEILFP